MSDDPKEMMDRIIARVTRHYQFMIGCPLTYAQEDVAWQIEDPVVAGLERIQAGIDDDGKIVCFRVQWRSGGPSGEITKDGFKRIS